MGSGIHNDVVTPDDHYIFASSGQTSSWVCVYVCMLLIANVYYSFPFTPNIDDSTNCDALSDLGYLK